MDPAEPSFEATAFAHNRDRPATHGFTAAFFERIVGRKGWPAFNLVKLRKLLAG